MDLDLNVRFSLGVWSYSSLCGNHLQVFCTIAAVQKVQMHNEWQLEWAGTTRGTAPTLASTGSMQWLSVLQGGRAAGREHQA